MSAPILDVEVVLPFADRTSQRLTDEAEAVTLAREWAGPNRAQVTITAHRQGDHWQTFANRHFTWRPGRPDPIRDSGWRLWTEGRFVGGGQLDQLGSNSLAPVLEQS